ncbi:MAG: hypothetical protein SOY88_02750, partial [Massilioclostridium sp.]|nr:hypothetical protein [Massilioclostridium sp.]
LDEVEGSAFKAGGFKLLGKSVCHFKHPFFLRTTLERKGNIVYNIDVPLPFRRWCVFGEAVLSFDGFGRFSLIFLPVPHTSCKSLCGELRNGCSLKFLGNTEFSASFPCLLSF